MRGEDRSVAYRPVSAKLTRVMTGNVVRLLLLLVTPALAQYDDDSDYNNFEFYENLPTSYERNANENYQATGPDDFYIIADLDDSPGTWNTGNDEIRKVFVKETTADGKPAMARQREKNIYGRPEKIYRYTKHRIPGYDYDELDFMSARGYQQCDEKSIWTNCMCQFTCQQPSVVDCFTPCKNGCECKEDYVFDEKIQRCVPPEQCGSSFPSSDLNDYPIYEK